MAVSDFQSKLKSLLESNVICENDCETYITLLYDLAKLLEHENGFPIYAIVVKNCIAGFRTIFSKTKSKHYATKFWETDGSKFCTKVTTTMFDLLQCFRKFDPGYTQEFYLRWKTIVSRMDVLKRANTFYSLIDKFKIVVGHLRTAASRTEQLAVMSVLRIYIECVPVTQLCRLNQHDNVEIIKLLAGFMQNPSILNRNEFLHRINTMGHCIESLKPKKIICSKLNIDMDDANHSMWLDFNKTEQTVSFAAVDLADYGNQTFATTHCVKLRESVKDSHLLEINGFWNVISVDTSQSSGQRVTVRVHFVDKTEELISTTVKTVFRFVNPGDVAGSASQGFISDYTEAEPAQDNILSECTPQMTPCLTVLMSLGQSEKKKSFALPTIPRHSIPKFTFTLEFLPNTRRESDESDAERPLQSNLSSVSPTAHSPTSDCKYTPSGTSANRLAGSSFQKSFHQNSVTLTGSPQENSESLKMNKSLNQPDVLPWASGTPETPQKIEETIECNAAIESSSLQASREKSWENLSQNQDAPKHTKCIAIADLPKMSSQFEPVTESEKEPTSSQKASEARRSFTSSQNSTKKPAPSSLQQRIEVPTVDPLAKSSQTNLDASRKRTKSPSSQILSVSAPQHYPNSEELGATVLIVSPLHSSQNQTAMSSQPSIQIVPIIDTSDDMESTLKAKRPKLSAEVAKISTDQKYNARVVLSRISNSQLYRYMLRKRPILNRCTSMYRTMF